MKALLFLSIAASLALSAAPFSLAQEAQADRVNVTLSDPSRQCTIKASLIQGGITVKAYDGKEVIVEARARGGRSSRSERPAERAEGMRRLSNGATGLTVTEENNVVEVGATSYNRVVDLMIQAPVSTSLKLSCINSGDIAVERVHGDIEVTNTNGSITLSDISGSAVAHALNDNIIVTFASVTPGKAMSFSSLNGKIDVTLPKDVKATLILSSDQGDIYSDFDLQVDQNSRQVVEDSRGKGGKYQVRIDKSIRGNLNGGGPEFRFKNFNGNIYIRKGK